MVDAPSEADAPQAVSVDGHARMRAWLAVGGRCRAVWRRGLTVLVAPGLAWLLAGVTMPVQAQDYLDVDQAFRASVTVQADRSLQLQWTIAPGYKLYRKALQVRATGAGAELAPVVWPAAERHFDVAQNAPEETYRNVLAVNVPVRRADGPFVLKLGWQGCADQGFCYPPVEARFAVDPGRPGPVAAQPAGAETAPAAALAGGPAASNAATRAQAVPLTGDETSQAQRTLQSGSWWRIGLAFGLFGLMLSLTPCVLPMIPILSSIIVAGGTVSPRRGLALAASYCLGMALIYTALGVAAGLAGAGLAAALQRPEVLTGFAVLLLVLSLSMFDVFTVQMPAGLQSRLSDRAGRLPGGRMAGVFAMGALSALIVGPCVAAPLAGALLFISQTGDVARGGFALFAMAGGMSVPLLLTGASAGRLLPRAGAWMVHVKHAFGLLLIATAIWMVQSVLPVTALMLLVGAWCLLCAVFLGAFEATAPGAGAGRRFSQALGWLFLLCGAIEITGAASGGRDPLQPLAHLAQPAGGGTVAALQAGSGGGAESRVRFARVPDLAALDQALAQSTRPVLLDFYADWCVTCHEMARETFSDPRVAERMGAFTLLQVDVTANSEADRALMKRFSLFGPPAIVFFEPGAKELDALRVIGRMGREPFLERLEQALAVGR